MTTPTIEWRDSIGVATLTTTSIAFEAWNPGLDWEGDRYTSMGAGFDQITYFRREDYFGEFQVGYIKPLDMGTALRLKSHLLTGGRVTINTNDSQSRVYTCVNAPGETPEVRFTDRKQLDYSLRMKLKNLMSFPMICDYSSYGGTPANEITNGGGESGTVGSQATGWTKASGNGLLCATDEVQRGSRSMKTTHTVTTSSTSQQSSISVTAGERWALSGWIKTEALQSGTSNGASLDLTQDTSAEWTVLPVRGESRSASITSPGLPATGKARDWAFCYALVDITTSGTVKVGCSLKTTGAGSAWWDDVRFEPVPKVARTL
jgi:hypothetical protein